MNIPLNPSPSALLESLRSIGYTLETALADIIDNSITAKACRISTQFLWENGKPWIAIADDGTGMSSDELIQAMRLGSQSPASKRAAHDLGRFGLGMKTASISQCRQLTVVSKKGRHISACEWNLDLIKAHDSEWNVLVLDEKALAKDKLLSELITRFLATTETGTIIIWRHLASELSDPNDPAGEGRFSAHMDAARKHLEQIFHRFLAPAFGQQKLVIDFNNTPLAPFDPFGSAVPARQELPAERIQIQGETIIVQPYVLPHRSKAGSISEYENNSGEDGYLHNQGFYIYRNRRLIIKATWFRLIPKDELNKLLRVRVDIPNSLDDLWRIDIKKSQASPPESVRKELKRIIHKISGSGRVVFTNRATRLQNRKITPMWKREVRDGQIQYGVNDEHPLVKALLKDLSKSHSDSLRACFDLLNSTFPYDMYYADAADDKTEFVTSLPTEETIRQVGIQLVNALRSCGFKGHELRHQMQSAEFFKCSDELLAEILNEN